MKNKYTFLFLIFILAACSKSNQEPPVITIFGNATIYVNVGDVYNDLGARAIDKVDGEISETISFYGFVDANKAGIYKVHYAAVNNRGVAAKEVIRTIILRNTIKKFAGYYNVTQLKKETNQNSILQDVLKFNLGNDTTFFIHNFAGLDSVPVSGYLTGLLRDSIVIPSQIVKHDQPINSYLVNGYGKLEAKNKVLRISEFSKKLNNTIESGSLIYTIIK